MEPLAKPTGILLTDHTRHVREQVVALLVPRLFMRRKYANLTGHDLLALVDKSAEWHDAGKQDAWQACCRLDYDEWVRQGRPRNFRGRHLQKSGIRHEMDSLRRLNHPNCPDQKLPLCAYTAIAAHHGKLGRQHEDRWLDTRNKHHSPKHREFWEMFERKGNSLNPAETASFDKAIRLRYEYDGPRALLQLADHRASALEEPGNVVPKLRAFDYQFPAGWEKRGVQKLIETFWDEPFAILRAPTGAGKTDASLLWAQRQMEAGRADRLVLAMPTRFTANALAVATAKSLSSTGLYHSSAWFQAKNSLTDAEKAHWKAELDYARYLETPVTVTTIDHLCLCLTGAREDHHAIFWNLAHSCVVIDEADFYDDFTQRNLVVLLRALRLLQVPVLLMSATVPESARALYALAGQHTQAIYEDLKDRNLTRPRCRLVRAGRCAGPADVEPLLRRGAAGEPLIIYANTVRRAQAYWDWFREHAPDFEDVVLYHSRFTEPHKFDIEERLKKQLGVDAWKTGQQRGIAILTQIGELSVNISADLMVSDVCPIDRLAQRVGRLARFTDRNGEVKKVVGELHLVEPYAPNKNGELAFYPAPYGHYRKKVGWEPSEVLQNSQDWLVTGEYSAQKFMQLVNRLYPKLDKPTTEAKSNAEKLEKMVVADWLIVPRHEIGPEDDDTPEWRSRDIDAQKTVVVEVNTSGIDMNLLDFSSFMAFREWSLTKSIAVPAYEYRRAKDNGMLELEKVYIGHDQKEEKIAVVKPPYYSARRGLAFEEKADFDPFLAS